MKPACFCVIGSYTLDYLRLLTSILPILLFMSIKICSRVCLHFSSVQVQGRKRFCLDTEGSRIWPDERKGISEGTRDGLAKPPFVEHAEAWSGARVFWTHPIAPGMSGVRSSCFPGPQQSFFHRSPNRLGADESIGFGLYDVTFSHPCTTSCSCLPWKYSHRVLNCALKGPKRASVAAWAPWYHGLGIQTASWEPLAMSSFSVLVA